MGMWRTACHWCWTSACQLSFGRVRAGCFFQGTQGGAEWVGVRSEGRPGQEEGRAGLWETVGKGKETKTGQEWTLAYGLFR